MQDSNNYNEDKYFAGPIEAPAKYSSRAILSFLITAIAVICGAWLFKPPVDFDIYSIAEFLPILISLIALAVIHKTDSDLIDKSIVPVVFVMVFSSWSFALHDMLTQLSANSPVNNSSNDLLKGISSTLFITGLCISIFLHQRFFKFAIYLSSACLITLIALLYVFTTQNYLYLTAIAGVLISSIAIGFISFKEIIAPASHHTDSKTFDDINADELLPSEIESHEIEAELAINTLPLNEQSPTHDWEQILRDVQSQVKPTSDVDQLFKNMLLFINERIEFDAAAVGMLQDRTLKKIATMGDDEYIHAQSLGWGSPRIKDVFSSRVASLSKQNHLSGSGSDVAQSIQRLDVPVITNQKAVGIVTFFRETLLFDNQDVKLMSSIVFNCMGILRQARLQDEIKRLSSGKSANQLTLYSRDQFVTMIQPVLEKLGKPRECSMFIVDVDNLHEITDTIGRDAATLMYKAVSRVIMNELTPNDILGRYGKEGFVVLMDETDLNGAKAKAETIREKISRISLNYQGQALITTASIGLTIVSDPSEDISTLMRKADMGLFVAKENGCNSVKVSL